MVASVCHFKFLVLPSLVTTHCELLFPACVSLCSANAIQQRFSLRFEHHISKLRDHSLLFALIPALILLDSRCFSHLLGTYFGRQIP